MLFVAAVLAHQQASLDEPRPMRLTTVKPPSSDRRCWRRWGRRWLPGRGGEFVLDAIQIIEETLNRVVAGEQVGAGGELDQSCCRRATAVHHVRTGAALANTQLLGEIQHRFGGRLAAEELVGDAAEREHIEARTMRGSARVVSGEVDHPRVFDIVPDVLGAGGAVNGVYGDADHRRCATPFASSSAAGATHRCQVPWTRMLCGPRAR